ncbi:BA14K family protein [Taklimakanibacter deserti]|uniref:BA14K family protein n=1 Tax=Taklimakanibacter deserti TaxID=2267839 RepID=UPI0034D6C936
MRYKPFAMAAAALVAGLLSFGGAQATSIMTGSGAPAAMTAKQDGNIQQVKHRKYWGGGKKYRYWRGGHRYRHSGVNLGIGFFPFFGGYGYPYGGYGYPYGYGYGSYPYYGSYYRPYYRTYYSGGGSAHVRWCYNHYRTYSARSNTFIGYDGYRHRCRSPYRY